MRHYPRLLIGLVSLSALAGCAEGSDVAYAHVVDPPSSATTIPGVIPDPAVSPVAPQQPVVDTAPIPTDVPGRWSLRMVGDVTLPAAVPTQEQGRDRSITAGRLTIEQDGTFLYRFDYHDHTASYDAEGSDGMAGIYRIELSEPMRVQLVDLSDGTTYIGTMISRSLMTVSLRGVRYQFSRASDTQQ